MNTEIKKYNDQLDPLNQEISTILCQIINSVLTETESKIWHAHPVWFIDGNPIVGYSKQKAGLRLMFWSGADFDEEKLNVRGKKFKDASIFFNSTTEIETLELKSWLIKSIKIQWDYKNIVKRKGTLVKLDIV